MIAAGKVDITARDRRAPDGRCIRHDDDLDWVRGLLHGLALKHGKVKPLVASNIAYNKYLAVDF